MQVKRAELLSVIETLKPAINDNSTVAELSCVWFKDGKASAYNDVIGVEVPMSMPFMGGMKGSIVSGLLASSTAEEVDITVSKESMTLRSGPTKAKLASFPSNRQIWTAPELPDDIWFTPSGDFLSSLSKVMVSTSKKANNVDEMGVTFILDDENLYLYTTDNLSVSKSVVPLEVAPELPFNRALVPAVFCELLLKMARGEEKVQLAFLPGGVIARLGQKIAFGRYMESSLPADFARIYKDNVPPDGLSAIALPKTLTLALDRAAILLGKSGVEDKSNYVEFHAEGKTLHMYTRTDHGTLDEDLELDGEHEDAQQKFNPKLVKRVLDQSTHFAVTRGAMVFFGDNFIHLICPKG